MPVLPTAHRAKSLVWYTGPLTPSPDMWPSGLTLPYFFLPTVYAMRCRPLHASCSMFPGLYADVPSPWMSCPLSPSSLRTAHSYTAFKTQLQGPFLCDTSLTHMAEHALPFAPRCSDFTDSHHYFPIRL